MGYISEVPSYLEILVSRVLFVLALMMMKTPFLVAPFCDFSFIVFH